MGGSVLQSVLVKCFLCNDSKLLLTQLTFDCKDTSLTVLLCQDCLNKIPRIDGLDNRIYFLTFAEARSSSAVSSRGLPSVSVSTFPLFTE